MNTKYIVLNTVIRGHIIFDLVYATIIFNRWPLRSLLGEDKREEDHSWEILRGYFLEVTCIPSTHILLAGMYDMLPQYQVKRLRNVACLALCPGWKWNHLDQHIVLSSHVPLKSVPIQINARSSKRRLFTKTLKDCCSLALWGEVSRKDDLPV